MSICSHWSGWPRPTRPWRPAPSGAAPWSFRDEPQPARDGPQTVGARVTHSTDVECQVDTTLGEIGAVDTGDGPPVLFVHGTPGGSDQGALMGRFLVAAGFRVI